MYYIGIDVGGTTIKGGIVAKDGTIIVKSSIPTEAKASYEEFAKSIADFCVYLTREAQMDMDEIESVGMGIPGTVDTNSGVVVYANNINLKRAPIREEFKKYIQKPIFMDNDANCAALSEYYSMGGEKIKDFAVVTLGTGVGGGIIVDGKLCSGFEGGGGEIGHMVLSMDGEDCTCGRKGCWEAYASATALVKQATEAANEDKSSALYKMMQENDGKLNGRMVWDASKAGDTTAKKVTDKYCMYVAQGITNIVNIFRPEIVVIGGGVSKVGDPLLEPVKDYVNKYYYGVGYSAPSRIEVASQGNDAGIIGAALLGRLLK